MALPTLLLAVSFGLIGLAFWIVFRGRVIA
jgi:hypothetical protein